MPPVENAPLLQLSRRHDTPDRTFAIIFGVIAVIVIIVCLVAGFCMSKLRKKRQRELFTSMDAIVSNGQDQNRNTISSITSFPSHPALLRGLRQDHPRPIQRYDPRTETPFPNTPERGDSISLPTLTPRSSRHNVGGSYTNLELLSTSKDRLPTRHGLNSGDLDSRNSGTLIGGEDCRQEYSIPWPKPVLRRARSSGRAPRLTRQLSQFPMPKSESCQSDKLVHPNKLFHDLEQRYSKTTITSNETSSSLPQAALQNDCVQAPATFSISDQHLSALPSKAKDEEITAAAFLDDDGIQATQPLDHNDDMHIELPSLGQNRHEHVPRNHTASTSDRGTHSRSSSFMFSSTPPSSPVVHLDVIRGREENRMSNRTEVFIQKPNVSASTTQDIRQTPSSPTLPCSDQSKSMGTIHEGKKMEHSGTKFFSSVKAFKRKKPPRLDLNALQGSSLGSKRENRHSMSSIGSMLMPLVRSKRPSLQGSSIYSRDTRGLSYARSPISPAFSIHTPGAASTQSSQMERLSLHRKASSFDLLRLKIDTWNSNTTNADFALSNLKRAFSDAGPRSPAIMHTRTLTAVSDSENSTTSAPEGLGITVPRICIGRASDDIFRGAPEEIESGRVLKRVIDMEVAASMANLEGGPMQRNAPGGAQWI